MPEPCCKPGGEGRVWIRYRAVKSLLFSPQPGGNRHDQRLLDAMRRGLGSFRKESSVMSIWSSHMVRSRGGSLARGSELWPVSGSPLVPFADVVTRLSVLRAVRAARNRACSCDERSLERLTPEPEPPRKMIPSRRIQSRIDSIESSIERMKQAEHCGFSSKPTLNQTGELKEASWLPRSAFSSASNVSASSSSAK